MTDICLSDKNPDGQALTFANYLSKLRRTFRDGNGRRTRGRAPDGREVAAAFNRWQRYNTKALCFLDVKCLPTGNNDDSIMLMPGRYTGTVPLISPYDGKVFGTLHVESTFGDAVPEILPLIGANFAPEFQPSMPIDDDVPIQAPIFMDCINFMAKFAVALRQPWQKFDVVQQVQPVCNAGTDWQAYALTSHNPWQRLLYPNRNNLLTLDHVEWRQLTYVLALAISEIDKYLKTRNSTVTFDFELLRHMRQYAAAHVLMTVNELKCRKSDPVIISDLKAIGNRILARQTHAKCAWRVDFAEFFERYCQFLCREVTRRGGGVTVSNSRLNITGLRARWRLAYLEPDIVMRRGDRTVVADAKYKLHLLNMRNASDDWHDAFRHDLHQVLAYGHVCAQPDAPVILMYPAERFRTYEMRIGRNSRVYLLGVPIGRVHVPAVTAAIEQIAFGGL